MKKFALLKTVLALTISITLIITVLYINVNPAVSEGISYINADVLAIGEQTIAVVPTGSSVEILEITPNNEIKKLSEAATYGYGVVPQSVVARIEKGMPIAYVAAGIAIQKYDLTSPVWPALVKSIDSPLGYVRDIAGRADTSLILVAGDKGIKEFETNGLSPIRDIWTSTSYGVDINSKGSVVITAYNQGITLGRNGAVEFATSLKHSEPHIKKPTITAAGTGYVADDNGVKKVGTDVTFVNSSGFGYSVDMRDSDDYLYFVNGWGIYKLDKNLQQIDFQQINDSSGWARGVKVFEIAGQTKILVLASDRIYLLNDTLEILDVYAHEPMKNLKNMSMDDDTPKLQAAYQASPPNQPLSVRISKAPVKAKDIITVHATGYFPGEPLTLEIGPTLNPPTSQGIITPKNENFIERTVADGNGNVVIEHVVISEQVSYPLQVNIRVYGENSHLHYQLSVTVIGPSTPPVATPPPLPLLTKHKETIKETETTREVTERTEGNKVIIHEIIYTTEKLVERDVAELEILGSSISPAQGRVKRNTYVIWTNKDTKTHAVQSTKTPDPNKTFNSELIQPQTSFKYKFDTVGTYTYLLNQDTRAIYEIRVEE